MIPVDSEGGAQVKKDHPAYAGQAVYTRSLLPLYDTIVMRYSMPWLWHCSKGRLVQLYDTNVSARHLDVGVGSGYLIDRCRFPSDSPEITLMDLNPNSLRFAARRLRRYRPQVHQANVLEPWGLPSGSFKSVAMANVLHCIPGNLRDKQVAFDYASNVLTDEGTLFGATILGLEAGHSRFASRAIESRNRKGVFCNLDDRLEDLEAGLAATFKAYEVSVQGTVALFKAGK